MSTLATCTSGARPAAPSTGDTLFETDTNKIIVYDGSVWRTYDSDGFSYATGGDDELHYPGGIWTDAGATYYCAQEPLMHFDAAILDGEDSSDNPVSGTSVPSWGNRSSPVDDYTAVQATGSYQPTFTIDGSDAYLDFDGGDYLTLNTAENDLPQQGTTVMVGIRNTTSDYFIGFGNGAGSWNVVLFRLWDGAGKQGFYGSSAVTTGEDMTALDMYTLKRDAANYTFYNDGANVVTGPTANTTATVDITEIGRGASSVEMTGRIYELLYWNDVGNQPDADDLNAVRLYLNNKYGFAADTAFS